MKTLTVALLAAAASFNAATFSTTAQTNAQSGEKQIVIAQTNAITATVEDIDHEKRHVTLKGPEGNKVKLAVSKNVKNFSQIKKGDEVKIGYYESVAIGVRKPGEELAPTSRTEALVTREPGQKPGALDVSVTEISATVEDIDRDSREVTLKGPEGNSMIVKVDPSVGDLSRIKKGDQITATKTEALAISVEKP